MYKMQNNIKKNKNKNDFFYSNKGNIIIYTMNDQSPKYITELSHKEFHIIMNRPQFKSDLSGQDADDYDAFIDKKIQEFIKAHNDKVTKDRMLVDFKSD